MSQNVGKTNAPCIRIVKKKNYYISCPEQRHLAPSCQLKMSKTLERTVKKTIKKKIFRHNTIGSMPSLFFFEGLLHHGTCLVDQETIVLFRVDFWWGIYFLWFFLPNTSIAWLDGRDIDNWMINFFYFSNKCFY